MDLRCRPVGLRFRPVDLCFGPVNLCFRPVDIRFRTADLCFRQVDLRCRLVGLHCGPLAHRFRSVGFMFALGLRSLFFLIRTFFYKIVGAEVYQELQKILTTYTRL